MTEKVKQMRSWIQEEEKEPMFQAPLSNKEVSAALHQPLSN